MAIRGVKIGYKHRHVMKRCSKQVACSKNGGDEQQGLGFFVAEEGMVLRVNDVRTSRSCFSLQKFALFLFNYK
jgi:hypothetical protein